MVGWVVPASCSTTTQSPNDNSAGEEIIQEGANTFDNCGLSLFLRQRFIVLSEVAVSKLGIADTHGRFITVVPDAQTAHLATRRLEHCYRVGRSPLLERSVTKSCSKVLQEHLAKW